MSRAAFISAGGDPFILLLSIHLFQRWKNEVDKLYVCYNSMQDKKIVDFIRDRLTQDSQIHLIYTPEQLGYGRPINECLNVSREDLILLLEDDGFVYNAGIVDTHFKRIELGLVDLVGSSRFSCGFGISRAAKKKWGLNYDGEGDVGCNFWPNFFFCKRSDLLKTNLDFAPTSLPKGVYVPELDFTPEEDEPCDTFSWTSIQLRAMGLKVGYCPQYKGSPFELEEKRLHQGKWANNPYGWIHAGSLSVFWNKELTGNRLPHAATDINLQEYETRVAFWTIAVGLAEYPEIREFQQQYRDGIEEMIEYHQMDRERIEKKVMIYKDLMRL